MYLLGQHKQWALLNVTYISIADTSVTLPEEKENIYTSLLYLLSLSYQAVHILHLKTCCFGNFSLLQTHIVF